MGSVQGSISGHMPLGHLITKLYELPVRAVVERLLLVLWALTTTVSQDTPILRMVLPLMTHCGMDKIAVELSVHAVTPQTSHGSVRSFLSQLLMTWSAVFVGMSVVLMRISPLTLLNSMYSEL